MDVAMTGSQLPEPHPGEGIAGLEVRRLSSALRDDFFRVHDEAEGCGWCCCVAWWVPSWDGWGDRTAGQNRALRNELLDRGEQDGYLLYDGARPVGWCQAGPRDRWPKLAKAYHLDPDPEAWAIPCFLILPGHRRRGLARRLLEGALADLRIRGARRIEAFPRRGRDLPDDDAWNGPEALFATAGFRRVRDVGDRSLYVLEWKGT